MQKPKIPETAWLDAAYQLLTENGVEAVKVMPLAKKLGVSRTGFYWHFRDRDALLEAMIHRWEEKNTGNLVARSTAYSESIGEAVFNLFDCWLDNDLFDAPLELAIRNWARNETELQERLDAADIERCRALTEMFSRHGYDPAQAHARAMTMIYTQIGYFSMEVIEDPDARLRRMPDYVEVFTGSRPSESDIRRFFARHTG
ncbi:TetR/AcrR family transcriptional regulator [uncultured Shimia sp.]|uniref:TetR/AcrR family transcriptional regulator n=1 Tax=uncultured Shimia sp. TaxID=573152 RepID=UPI00342C36E0